MKAFVTLTRLQLYLRLSALKPSHWLPKRINSLREWRPLLMGLVFVAVMGSMMGTVIFLADQMLTVFIQIQIPELLLSMVILLCMAATVIIGFFHVMSVLYFSRDSAFLAGLPVSSQSVMASKLAVVLLGEIGVAALIFLPVCVLYGIRTGQTTAFYLKALVTALFIPSLPLAVSTLLSTLLIRFSSLFRHRDRWAVIGGFALIALIVPFQMRLYGGIPQDADAGYFMQMFLNSRDRLEAITGSLPPVLWATSGVTGNSAQAMQDFALFVLSSAAALGLALLLCGKSFLQLSILQNEAFQKAKRRKLRASDFSLRRTPIMALFFREWQEILRVPAYALNGLVGIVMLPIMMVAFFLGSGSSGEMSELLTQLLRHAQGEQVMLLLTAAMAFGCTVNMAGATAVSREGKRFPFTRMIPVPFQTQLMAKQLFGFSINFLTCLSTAVTLMVLLPGQALYVTAALVMGLLFGFFTNALSLVLDVKHPRFDWRNETEAIKQNPMALVFMVLSMGVAFVLGFGVWGLYKLGVSLSLVSGLLALALALLAWAAYLVLLREADKSYAKIEM